MKFLMVCLMGLMLSAQANTAPQSTVSGQVRLADGRPVVGAQVTLFDLADLHQGAVARAMTDESGYFALPLASLDGSALPQGFALGQNYPNPFNPLTVIPYQLPTAAHVRLDVFNVLGQHVATLVDAERQAGFHAAKWDATDAAGQAMAAGVYLYRLTTSGGQQIHRMVLIDGQAGIAVKAPSAAAIMSADVAEREYGLVVSGEGLTTYTDVAFGVRAGMAAVELVVEAAPLTMASGKRASGNSDNFPSWSPDGQQIAFASDRDGNFEIYVRDADRSNLRRLTNNGDRDVYPSWSPDGQQIAFVSNRDGNFEIYVMDADGSNPENRTNNPASDSAPSWSPDGLIAFMSNRDGNSEIYVIGWGVFSRLTHDPTDAPAWDRFPSWSPDGQQIAFASDREGDSFEIYVMDADGSDMIVVDDEEVADDEEIVVDDGEVTDDEEIVVDDGEVTDDEEIVVDDEEVADDEKETVSLLPGEASMEFVWIEPGVFQMGSNTGRSDESPRHEVEISRGFWLGKYEITQGQWEAVMGTTPWSGRDRVVLGPSHPAVIISWDEVQEFIGRLNAEAGEELYRLPTEAEWEYACRAGTQTRWSFGDDESLLTDYAWYNGNNDDPKGAKVVGTKRPNPWGLHDMHGNVWEWVQDWYDEDYYSRSPRVDPQGPTSGRYRVIRGGHFGFNHVQSAYRHLHEPHLRSDTIGVRLLRMPGD